jgi:hypothetical protein
MTTPATCPTCPHKAKVRSRAQHNRYFAMMSAMYHHWPDGLAFVPEDDLHLRSWAECHVGFCTHIDVTLRDGATEDEIRVAIQTAKALIPIARKPSFVAVQGLTVRVKTPKSVSETTQREFAPMADAVEQFLRNYTGLDPAQCLRERERAA